MLRSEGRDSLWNRGLGRKREKVPKGQVRVTPSLSADPKKGLRFSGFSLLLSTQLFYFRSSVSWRANPAGLFSPGLSLPLQGVSFSAFREALANHGPVFGNSHLLVK